MIILMTLDKVHLQLQDASEILKTVFIIKNIGSFDIWVAMFYCNNKHSKIVTFTSMSREVIRVKIVYNICVFTA